MSDQRRHILERLRAGEISVEEADARLDDVASQAGVSVGQAGQVIKRDQQGRVWISGPGQGPRRNLLVRLVAAGASIDFIQGARDAGLLDALPPDMLVSLAHAGADVPFILRLRDSGLLADFLDEQGDRPPT
jgi:hypothetical protein